MRDRMNGVFSAAALDAFDELHAGILITDHESRPLHANRHLCNLLGIEPGTAHDMASQTFVRMHRQDADSAHGQREVRFELEVGGNRYNIVISTAAISAELLMSVIQNITRIVTQYSELRAELDQIKEQVAALLATDVIPMCMECHKVRLRDGSWVAPARPDVLLKQGAISHGFCPPCAADYFRRFGV